MTIPRTFHRIWIPRHEQDVIPARFQEYWKMFQDLHPDWEFKTWGDESYIKDWLVNRDLWDVVNPLAGRTDLLRYEIILREGGIYVDADVEPLRAFDDLLHGDPFMGWESEDRLCPTVIGGEAGHPALAALVEGLPGWVQEHAEETDPVVQTGPIYVTEQWRSREDVRRLPPVYFYPVGPTERKLLGGPYPGGSYSVHHWNKGWGNK